MSGVRRRLHRQPLLEKVWWSEAVYDGHPLRSALSRRDITTIFRFLARQGWSQAAIAAAVGMSEFRVRRILHGAQRVTSYEVLERIAEGLMIDRGLMGLAYTEDLHLEAPQRETSAS